MVHNRLKNLSKPNVSLILFEFEIASSRTFFVLPILEWTMTCVVFGVISSSTATPRASNWLMTSVLSLAGKPDKATRTPDSFVAWHSVHQNKFFTKTLNCVLLPSSGPALQCSALDPQKFRLFSVFCWASGLFHRYLPFPR